MRYRDARGRFRKPTDEERWPDERERAHVQMVRALLTPPDWLIRAYGQMMADAVRDLEFTAGAQWPRKMRE